MANQARVTLENALRAKQLDRTLTTLAAPFAAHDGLAAGTGIQPLDLVLQGGFPLGQLSEIADRSIWPPDRGTAGHRPRHRTR